MNTFNVKTLGEIAQLVFFKEKPPDELTVKQLPVPAKKLAMALHVHAQELLSYIYKNSIKFSSQRQNRPQNVNCNTEYLCPKTLHALAARAEEEDVELKDMAIAAGSFSLP